MRLVIKLIFLVFLVCGQVGAKDLFVATDGSDAVTYANNDTNNEWLTPAKAWLEALAGDTVYFKVGTYTISSQIDTIGGNNGTSENPINFTRYQTDSVTFSSSSSLEALFAIQTEYIYVSNINFDSDSASIFDVGEDGSGRYFKVSYCTVDLTDSSGGDNSGFVKFRSGGSYGTVEYNTITGNPTDQSMHDNAGGIYIARAAGVTIQNNEISQFPIGIYFKHANTEDSNDGGDIINNYIYELRGGATFDRSYSIFTNQTHGNISNNIIGANCPGDFRVNETNGVEGGDNNTIEHNTIFSGLLEGLRLSANGSGADNNTIKNNITFSYTTCCDGNVWDYNMYVSGSAIGANDLGNTSPTYVGGASPSTIAGYALDSGSNGENAADDGEDMGADVTLVGPGGEESASTPGVQGVTFGVGVGFVNQ